MTLANSFAAAADDNPIAKLSGLLKAAGDPLRLDILRLLGQSSLGVMELAEVFAMRQSGMSHHLKVLWQAGLVETRREGNAAFYRRRLPCVDDLAYNLHGQLLETLDAQPLEAALEAGLERIQDLRALQSRDFFSRFVEVFAERQDLIAEHELYDDAAWEMLQRAKPLGGEKALEVGPGAGHFLVRLARHFNRVQGLDCSQELLSKVGELTRAQVLDNIELTVGLWPKVTLDSGYDLVAFNMVLHHLPAPARCVARAAELLANDGVLLITELCRHEQDWVSDSCGDLWQGFDEAELADWAARAGLEPLESQFLAQKNGFQIQILSFRKKPL